MLKVVYRWNKLPEKLNKIAEQQWNNEIMWSNKGWLIEHWKTASLKINKSIKKNPRVNIFSLVFPFRKSLLSSTKPKVTFFFNILVCLCAFGTGRTCQCAFAFAWESSFGWGTNVAAALHVVNVFLVALWCLSTLIQPRALWQLLMLHNSALAQLAAWDFCWKPAEFLYYLQGILCIAPLIHLTSLHLNTS